MDLVELVEAASPLWLLLWVGWVTQAVLSALLVRKFLRRRVLQGSPHRFDYHRPRAFVMVPFKGADDDLPAAIRSLMTQDYPDYRVICVVAGESDPAHAVLRRELARYPKRYAEIVIAGEAPRDRGQKVHNLLAAIDRADPQSRPDDVWVFADSDAVPGRQWLGKMAGPLIVEHIGVATGYRWLVPERGASIWSDFASVLNGSVACFLGRDNWNHAWGGSMAMRVSIARQGELVRRFDRAMSDDYQVTRMCRDLGLRVQFVPECLVASPVSLSLRSMLNFSHRQHLITRVHAPLLFYGGLGVTGYYVLSFVLAWAMLGHWLYHDPAGGAWLAPLIAMVTVFGANVARSHYRRQVVRHALGRGVERRMGWTLWIDRYLTPVAMALHLALLVRASAGRQIAWRGIRYRIDGPQQVKRLDAGLRA